MEIAWKHLGLSAPPWVQVHRKVSKLRWPMQYKSHQQITKTFLKNQKTLIHVTKDMSHSTYFFWLLKVFHDLTFHFNFLEMILVFFEMFFHFFVDFLKIKSCFFIFFIYIGIFPMCLHWFINLISPSGPPYTTPEPEIQLKVFVSISCYLAKIKTRQIPSSFLLNTVRKYVTRSSFLKLWIIEQNEK